MSKMPLLENFRANLLAACREQGITQQELAKRSGVHYVTISRVFSGKQDPSVELCEKLATGAGVRPDTIFLEPLAIPALTPLSTSAKLPA